MRFRRPRGGALRGGRETPSPRRVLSTTSPRGPAPAEVVEKPRPPGGFCRPPRFGGLAAGHALAVAGDRVRPVRAHPVAARPARDPVAAAVARVDHVVARTGLQVVGPRAAG